jgi:hypothetical protein
MSVPFLLLSPTAASLPTLPPGFSVLRVPRAGCEKPGGAEDRGIYDRGSK